METSEQEKSVLVQNRTLGVGDIEALPVGSTIRDCSITIDRTLPSRYKYFGNKIDASSLKPGRLILDVKEEDEKDTRFDNNHVDFNGHPKFKLVKEDE